MNEVLGKWSFWVMFAGFNLGFFPMHILGLIGMPRRIYMYTQGLGFESNNMLVTVGAFVLAIGILISIVNLLVTLHTGEIAGKNPWNADGLLSAQPLRPRFRSINAAAFTPCGALSPPNSLCSYASSAPISISEIMRIAGSRIGLPS